MSKVYGIHTRVLPLVIMLLIAPQLFAQSSYISLPTVFSKSSPTIATEKRNYQPNELVDIAGVDFLGYERVQISVAVTDPNLKEPVLLSRWDVYADAGGRIAADWKVAEINRPDVTFVIRAVGEFSGKSSLTKIVIAPEAGEAVNIDQCANSDAVPQTMNCPNAASLGWVNGNVNANKAKYFEGDSVAYRARFSNLTPGSSYTFQIGYDTTEGSINTIDYLTTYNRTIMNANPCRLGADANGLCTAGAPTTTVGIPIDPNVTNGRDTLNGTPDDIVQDAGVFSMWNGNLVSVSGYTYDAGFPFGNIQTSVSVTFTATNATAVLAWGGHIATRSDWGQAFGAVNRTGSPFHMRNEGLTNNTDTTTCCGGQQELQLSVGAVTPTAKIIIIKHASPPSNYVFGFTTTNLTPGAFTMTDNSMATDPMQVFDGISTFDVKTIEETAFAPYVLRDIDCTVDIGTGGTPAPVRVGNAINIDIKSGDQVTCTFNNDFVTAANVSVAGRVLDGNGLGLRLATVSVTDSNGFIRSTRTNAFGFYTLNDLEAGGSYIFNVKHWSHTYSSRLVNLDDNLTGFDFMPN